VVEGGGVGTNVTGKVDEKYGRLSLFNGKLSLFIGKKSNHEKKEK